MSKPDKFILDATAGFRMMWFNKHEPHTIYLDQRPECEPDIVGDFRDLKQFPDKTFRLIVFDPPHMIGKWHTMDTPIMRNFGGLVAETWQSDIRKGFSELWRVLKPFGVLLFKWNNHDIPTEKIVQLFPITPLFGQQVMQRINKHGDNRTLWFCFMKIENEKKEGV